MSGRVKGSNGMWGDVGNPQKSEKGNEKYRFKDRTKKNVVTQVDNVHQILKGHDISNRDRQWSVNYIPRRKSGIYWIQVRRAAAAAAAAVEISLWTR